MKSLRSILAAAILAGVASLAQSAPNELKSIDIPAGDLTAALELLARQSGVEVVYRPEQLKGVQTKGVQGTLSSKEAVTKLLEGTALTLRMDRSGVLLITEAGTPLPGVASEASTGAEEVRLVQAGSDTSQGMQSAQPSPSEEEGQGEDKKLTTDTEKESESARRAIPEILVKGSRGGGSLNAEIRRDENDVQPYVVLGSDVIRKSGATDLQSFMRQNLTAASDVTSSLQTGASVVGNATSFNLRGLGAEQTLILVNGRRVASIGIAGLPRQTDLGGIPLSAVERIEVLPSTASGLFGGGATGGVINVILKQNYSGLDVLSSFDVTTLPDIRTRSA